MKRFINWLIESNIFIGLCAACMASVVYEKSSLLDLRNLSVILLIFCATIVAYTLNRHGRIFLKKGYPWSFRIVFILAGLLSISSAYFLLWYWPSFLIELGWIPIVLLGIYSSHLIFSKSRVFNIRALGITKLLLIAAVWTYVVVFMPAAYVGLGNWYKFFLHQFLFILAISIPFDIRDSVREAALGFKTVPAVVGKEMSVNIVKILLVAYWLLGGFLGAPIFIASSVCALLLLYWVNRLDQLKDWKDWVLRFDGIMIIQSIVIVASYYLIKVF